MSRYPWFRVYNEILTERKIERIGRMTHLPRVIIRGAWTTILAMANDSPQRGYLMWTDSLWITEAELCADLEMEPAEFTPLLDAFVKMQMVTRHDGGGLSCTNFDKRQFKSDNSTPRVQAWRDKQQSQGTDGCNVSETLLCNAPDTETEADPESETEADPDTQQSTPAPAAQPAPLVVDDVLYQELVDIGMATDAAEQMVGECDHAWVRGWLRHVKDNGEGIHNPAGLIWDKIVKKKKSPPPPRAPPGVDSKEARRRYVSGEYGDVVQH